MNLPPCRWLDGGSQADSEANVPFLLGAISLCQRTRRAVQAGGCHGLYPLILAEHFDEVLTFEPDKTNRDLLCENVAREPKIKVRNEGLSNTSGERLSVHRHPKWAVCSRVEKDPAAEVISLALDDAVREVDFLQLDIEGFEPYALQGASRILVEDRPVVMLEVGYGHCQNYGFPVGWCEDFLAGLGYREMLKNASDKVFVHV